MRFIGGTLLIAMAIALAAFGYLMVLDAPGTRRAALKVSGGAGLVVGSALLAAGAARIVTRKPRRRRQLLVLSITSCALVIVAGVAITTLMLRASGRSRPRRTMADMRAIAMALEARATDLNEYPSTRSIDELATLLEPTYIKKLPRTDAWDFPFRYEGSQDQYWIGSGGVGGQWEKPRLRVYQPGGTNRFASDIIFSNGAFVRYPEGVQQP